MLSFSVLASDLASKLDRQEDATKLVRTVKDTPQVHPLVEKREIFDSVCRRWSLCGLVQETAVTLELLELEKTLTSNVGHGSRWDH